MQFPGKDGKSYPSQMQASQSAPKPASTDSAQESKPSIQDNPQAMKCVDELKSLGYTADDVAQAMDDGAGMDQGAEATKAAPLQIPGLGMQ
jgi:hypothetical protein